MNCRNCGDEIAVPLGAFDVVICALCATKRGAKVDGDLIYWHTRRRGWQRREINTARGFEPDISVRGPDDIGPD